MIDKNEVKYVLSPIFHCACVHYFVRSFVLHKVFVPCGDSLTK